MSRPDRQGPRPALTRRQVLALGAALPFLRGCGATAPAPTTVRAFFPLDAYERAFFERHVLPPLERQANVRVQLAGGTGAEALGQLWADQRAGVTSLDLLAVDLEALGGLIAGGLVDALDDQRQGVPATTIPTLLPALEAGGTLYALPFRPAVWVTFYNEALLGARGLTPPATLDELLAVATTARAANGDGLVAVQGAEGAAAAQSLIELVWAFGGDPLALDDAGSRAAGAYLARLAPALAPVSAEAKFDSMTTALGSDRVALGANWAVVAADLLQRGGKRGIGVYAGPAGPSGDARLLSGQVLVALAKAAGRAGALALARYLWSRPVQEQLAANLAWTPMRTDAFDAAPAWQRPVATVALAALQSARALPPLPDRDAAHAALSDAFRGIAFQQVPPAQALERAASRLRALR